MTGGTGETGETGGTGVGTLEAEATFSRHARRSGPAGHPAASPASHTSLARHGLLMIFCPSVVDL